VNAPSRPTGRVLIVNADDFGLTSGVSRGILECYERGIVTSTTLMVNRGADPALLDALRASGLGVGLHVNLTLGAPVSEPRRVASLLDDGGQFVRDARLQAERAKPEEARIEIGNQIEEFRRLMGRFPTHLDSHHHVAKGGALLDLLCFFAKALKVPMRAQDAEVRTRARKDGIATPEHFVGDAGSEPYWSADRVLEHLRTLPSGVTEFMTHPGYFDDDLAYSRYGKQRETEVAGLTDPEARAVIARQGIRLAHFGNL
jgi:predicted glycoside hydrolase/deacetylase ChbG (UPF0249 family)